MKNKQDTDLTNGFLKNKPNKIFGIYVGNINLGSITEDDVINIKKWVALYGLIVFKSQKLNDKELRHFGERTGNGNLEQPARNISLSPDRRYVAWLTNLKDAQGNALGVSDNRTDYWHSDQEFRVTPASISILYCEHVNCSGGETSFASTNVKHANVDNNLTELLRSCQSTRRPALSHDNVPDIRVEHPAVLSNGTDEFFYISENTLDITLNRVKLKDSDNIKKQILRSLLTEDNIYPHTWSPGDLLLYDNAQLIHRREFFSGERFIKALKIHPDTRYSISISGKEI